LSSKDKLKDFCYVTAFLIIVILIEFSIIQFSILMGVSDSLTINLGIFTISPLFHILPIIVVLVLTLNWLYLKEALTLASYRKKRTEKIGKKGKGGKIKILRKIDEFFSKIKLPESFREKVIENNIFKGAFATLIFFFSLFLIAYLVVYPDLLYKFTYSILNSNPSLLGFVIAIRNLAFSIGQTLSPLGWIASSIDNGLKSAAPGFRNAFEGFGSLVKALASLDANSKYILCQNLAAWIPALAIIMYHRYVSRPRIIKAKRRRKR